jgi:hypothetical protein
MSRMLAKRRTTATNRQARAVMREYQEALEDSQWLLAERIWDANPDLSGHFTDILYRHSLTRRVRL